MAHDAARSAEEDYPTEGYSQNACIKVEFYAFFGEHSALFAMRVEYLELIAKPCARRS
jgi:hypothetical protein